MSECSAVLTMRKEISATNKGLRRSRRKIDQLGRYIAALECENRGLADELNAINRSGTGRLYRELEATVNRVKDMEKTLLSSTHIADAEIVSDLIEAARNWARMTDSDSDGEPAIRLRQAVSWLTGGEA